MTRPLSRRTLLRGIAAGSAVGLSLPLLEAMIPRQAHAEGSVDAPIFGLFFWANGLPWHAGHGQAQGAAGHPDLWTPPMEGAYSPSPLLMPLARHDVSVVTGLHPVTEIPSAPAGQGDGHMRGFMVATTGDRPRPERFDHPTHTLTALRGTLDQFVARHPDFYGESPARFRSLALGVSPARFHDYGHWNNISYNGPDSINPAILDPARLYEQLFSVTEDRQLARRADLLDAVLDDAADLRTRLGQADRHRVDAHMEHLFEIQRRLDLGAGSCDDPGAPAPVLGLAEKNRVMASLLARALACNTTRVFSYMLTSPATTHLFTDQGAHLDMHTTCHEGHWEIIYDITLHQMDLFAEFLDALDAEVDPTGQSVLDRAMVYGTSEYGEGWRHSVEELPVVLAGGACGRLVRGHHVREHGGNLCRAQLTALRALGLELESFGWNGAETTDAFEALLA